MVMRLKPAFAVTSFRNSILWSLNNPSLVISHSGVMYKILNFFDTMEFA